MDFTQLFLYIPGVVIFLIGSGMVRTRLSGKKGDAEIEASVLTCTHIVKNDRKGNETYNYYTIIVEYPDARTGKPIKKTVKSPTEYYVGQPVRMIRQGSSDVQLAPNEAPTVFDPWSTMIGGALLILLAMYTNQGKEVPAMVCLASFLIGAGAIMVFTYWKENKRNLIKIDSTITNVFQRQISKETKIMRGNKFTYYPVVSYEIDGIRYQRRLTENASSEKAYKEGEIIPLFYDTERKCIVEKQAGKTRLIWGLVLLLIGILAAVSIIGGISMGAK